MPGITKGLQYIKEITYYQGFEELIQWGGWDYHKHGWNHYGPGYFKLDRKTGIVSSSGGMGLFWFSAKKYDDFILDLEYKCNSPKTNSGIFLRVPDFVTSNDYIYHSFEVQIDDDAEPVHQTGAVYDANPPLKTAFKPTGEWNHYRITFKGNNIKVELNGILINDWEAKPSGKIKDFASGGYIGMQNHGDNETVSFRNVFVKELK